jgi:lipoprotein-anchoring transpeptidase ErfK/SrfK
MSLLTRRGLLVGLSATAGSLLFGGCATRAPQVDPKFLRQEVAYDAKHAPNTIVVDPDNHFLYHVQAGGRAMRYGVGVGGEGFGWSGTATIQDKHEWPNWYPTKEILHRKPEIREHLVDLPGGGVGMPGGPENPLGARAMYLYQGKKDTLYRIHGTNEPWTIGQSVSAGCIRMINDEVVDLYAATPIGTKVVVLPSIIARAT